MTTATDAPPLKLIRLEISDFMRVNALTVDAQGRHVVLTGGNTAGKTSAVDAIWAALGGKPSREMPEPVHRGADRATVRLDLGEYIVERVWTEKATKLAITGADGSKAAKPQALLDGLLGRFSLDPVSFLDRRSQDQVDDVLAICGVLPPVEQVEEITAERHDPRPGESASAYLERLSADQTGTYYVRRRDANREMTQKQAALQEQRQLLDRIGGPIRPDEGEASASAILEHIEQLQQKADERRAVQQTAEGARREHSHAEELLAKLTRDEAAESLAIAEMGEELSRKIGAHYELQGRIEKGREVVAELAAERAAADEAAAKLPDLTLKIQDLRRQVATVETANAAQSKRRHIQEQLRSLGAEHQSAEAQHRQLDNVLEALRGLRAHLLDGVDLGIGGLQIGNGELRLNGVSFRQASMAEQMRTACGVAMRQNPRLKLLRVDGGEALDRQSRELLFRLADEHGWQVIFTSVADTDGLRVEIIESETTQ